LLLHTDSASFEQFIQVEARHLHHFDALRSEDGLFESLDTLGEFLSNVALYLHLHFALEKPGAAWKHYGDYKHIAQVVVAAEHSDHRRACRECAVEHPDGKQVEEQEACEEEGQEETREDFHLN
jgi:hypothetical protein